ncbi:hypothetical protein Deipr_2506 (plasmid) [Deinococcus proteolyticus MRP]|uniref:PIN domain-containing protein n=1 Tax=Deinococcus proteolyticus (strain ATCC 35074 / DSM 20540 / JCM 6276 / NBRC 101906 / NCIMB 13154 / VKM Ac-1939 / CCM 2703 / MRP) TaxID=693977 RepID=F0RQR4_DEIPM|nr:hypothetical protein [Deinococcus proteolyticus]ADY27623.1 hypothetical protein Deipr_2506 [Deinococcus proteolyticus MRP]
MTSRSGPSFELYQRARRFEVIFILCEAHFLELAQVLTYDSVLRLGSGIITPSYAFSTAAELHRIGEYHDRIPGLDWPSCPDPKDWYLLDLLLAAEADGIVSKDKHLLRMSALGVPVMTPGDLKHQGLI